MKTQKIIKHARESLLYNSEAWMKKTTDYSM